MAAKLITVGGDVFRADEIVAITVEESTLHVELRSYGEEMFEYSYDLGNEPDARAAQLKTVADWNNALSAA